MKGLLKKSGEIFGTWPLYTKKIKENKIIIARVVKPIKRSVAGRIIRFVFLSVVSNINLKESFLFPCFRERNKEYDKPLAVIGYKRRRVNRNADGGIIVSISESVIPKSNTSMLRFVRRKPSLKYPGSLFRLFMGILIIIP